MTRPGRITIIVACALIFETAYRLGAALAVLP